MKITIYSIAGEKVTALTDGFLNKGYHEVEWNGTNQAGANVFSGVYIYELNAGKEKIVKRMLFAK